MGLVIERTKSFPCVIVKKTFQVTCGVASFQIQKMKLILLCRVPVSQRFGPPADLDPRCPNAPADLDPLGPNPPASVVLPIMRSSQHDVAIFS